MGHRCVKPKAPARRTPECKILVHGPDWTSDSAVEVMCMMTSGKVPLPAGWSPDEASPDKYVKMFPWFLGGRIDRRVFFRHHRESTDAIILVLDDTYHDLDCAKQDMEILLTGRGLENAVIIVLHNHDCRDESVGAERTTMDEVKKAIGFDDIPKAHRATTLSCCSSSGEGIDEVVKYLTQTLLSENGYDVEKKLPEVKPEVDAASIIKHVETTLKDSIPIVPESA